MTKYLAIDFETATHLSDSACAVGLTLFNGITELQSFYTIIRPPSEEFEFTHIHGITWETIKNEKPFDQVWPYVSHMIEAADYFVAHNAPFDRSVLSACCTAADIDMPGQPFICTLKLVRQHYRFNPARLSDVCDRLNIPLNHHHAASDSSACAQVLQHALSQGINPKAYVVGNADREARPRFGVALS